MRLSWRNLHRLPRLVQGRSGEPPNHPEQEEKVPPMIRVDDEAFEHFAEKGCKRRD
jgi:hypothetical protein